MMRMACALDKRQYPTDRATGTGLLPGGAFNHNTDRLKVCYTAFMEGEEILSGWQEIADYLKRSVRTVQRYQKSGLPVHRLPGSRKGSVFGNKKTMREWLASSGDGKQAPAPPANTSGEPEHAVLTGNVLTALDALGRPIWTHRFDAPLRQLNEAELGWRIHVVDLHGQGHRGVLAACSYRADGARGLPSREELFYFSQDGSLEWTLPARPDLLDFNGQPFEDAWRFSHLMVVPAGSRQTIWVGLAHLTRWAGCVLRVNPQGSANVQFANAGHVECFCRVNSGDGNLIVVSGENNAYDCSFVASFGMDDPPSRSPVGGPPRYRFANTPMGDPRTYILFPRTELDVAQAAPYGHARHVRHYGDAIIVEVEAGRDGSYLLYEFSDRLQPKVVAVCGSHEHFHHRLEQEGSIDHPLQLCPELARPLTLRRWEPNAGWHDQEIPWRLPHGLL